MRPAGANLSPVRELAAALPRTLAALPARIPRPLPRPSFTARTRRRLLAAALATVLVGALYQFWFRDSSVVAVRDVAVSGLTSKDAPRIEAALTAAAEEMTTLHVRVEELEEAVAGFPVVSSIAVKRDFPHGLHIEVIEHRPVALVSVDDTPLPAAGDGTVLTGLRPPKGLALLRMEKPPADGRVTDPRTLRALTVAGAAPVELSQRIERLSESSERGIVVGLRDGPDIYFGDADRADAKWVAATRILADPSAQGASYIDVRLPERPVAGGLPVETIEPVAPAGEPIAPPPAAPDAAVPAEPDAAVPAEPGVAAPVDPAPTTPQAAVPAPEAAPPVNPQP